MKSIFTQRAPGIVLRGYGAIDLLRQPRVHLAIEDALDDGLPRAYSKQLYET